MQSLKKIHAWAQMKVPISALNVIAIRVQRHANVSKQATLLDGHDVSPLKWRVCGCGLNLDLFMKV